MLEVLVRAVRQLKAIKGIHVGKKEVKVSFLADGMIVYISGSQNSTREVLQMINTSSDMTGYKVNSRNKQTNEQRTNICT